MVCVPKTYYLFIKLKQQQSTDHFNVVSGKIAYMSIKENLKFLFTNNIMEISTQDDTKLRYIDASVNIDGLPLLKYSPLALWPILIDFDDMGLPLPVSVFCGNNKPNFHTFLEPFVE